MHLLRLELFQTKNSTLCVFFSLPVSPHPGAQNVRNSAKSVLLAAKAMVSVARCCCALRRTSWMDAEGWDTAALPPPLLLLFLSPVGDQEIPTSFMGAYEKNPTTTRNLKLLQMTVIENHMGETLNWESGCFLYLDLLFRITFMTNTRLRFYSLHFMYDYCILRRAIRVLYVVVLERVDSMSPPPGHNKWLWTKMKKRKYEK